MVGSLRQYCGDGRESKDISWVDGRELAPLTFLSWKSRRGPSHVSDVRIERMGLNCAWCTAPRTAK